MNKEFPFSIPTFEKIKIKEVSFHGNKCFWIDEEGY